MLAQPLQPVWPVVKRHFNYKRHIAFRQTGRKTEGNHHMGPFPSFVEHQGVYNVTFDDLRSDDLAPNEDPYTYARSVNDLPPLTLDEFWEAWNATYHCLVKHGRFPELGERAAESFYYSCVYDELEDRTVRVELPNIRALTVDLVRCLQNEVLAARPLWRVMTFGESLKTVVMIYPEVVRLGTIPAGGDWVSALPRVVELEEELREPREGPCRRQTEYLKPKVIEGLRALREQVDAKPFRVLALFDNWRGDPSEWPLSMLYRGENGYDFSMEMLPSGEVGSTDHYAVAENGAFGDYLQLNSSQFWLSQWILPAAFCGEVILCRDTDGMRWTIKIEPGSVIKDADLKSKEESARIAKA